MVISREWGEMKKVSIGDMVILDESELSQMQAIQSISSCGAEYSGML